MQPSESLATLTDVAMHHDNRRVIRDENGLGPAFRVDRDDVAAEKIRRIPLLGAARVRVGSHNVERVAVEVNGVLSPVRVVPACKQ